MPTAVSNKGKFEMKTAEAGRLLSVVVGVIATIVALVFLVILFLEALEISYVANIESAISSVASQLGVASELMSEAGITPEVVIKVASMIAGLVAAPALVFIGNVVLAIMCYVPKYNRSFGAFAAALICFTVAFSFFTLCLFIYTDIFIVALIIMAIHAVMFMILCYYSVKERTDEYFPKILTIVCLAIFVLYVFLLCGMFFMVFIFLPFALYILLYPKKEVESASSQNSESLENELGYLKYKFESGQITNEEYEAQKEQILNKL